MPVILAKIFYHTKVDKSGRLRSVGTYACDKCGIECTQRAEEIRRRGALCKKCKLTQNFTNEFSNKNLELTCANVLKSRLNKRYLKRGLTCTLSGEEILKLVKDVCHYCGTEHSNNMLYNQPNFKYNFIYNGIDRIDSSKGYIQGNVVTCCKTCNVAKMDMDYQQFINHITKIFNHIRNANI
jgi:hypothetical protein